ncbi:DEAD/DEAH box helicase family protein [Gluconacetobacter tumulicola]|uniref:DEAD/DEAH box helicase family protein n=1 Tax=Gluconacetobacter tumulicola TaxID=1017177 RepID=A0A7W4JH95_9PROT|nr:DEAD/DEAH box helicase family protein [Gluconacetobacter tumulicola]MBB2181224.1 DEAD/DEAH box helicase family protein [Gluconacetobacter tumulicola]
MKIKTLNALPASGKTEAAIEHIAQNLGSRFNHIIWVSPTTDLLEDIKQRMIDKGIPNHQINVIHTYNTQNVAEAIKAHRFDRGQNSILMITSSSVQWIEEYQISCDFMVVDEEIKAVEIMTEKYTDAASRAFCERYIVFDDHPTNVELMLPRLSSKMKSLDRTDSVYLRAFKDLFDRMESNAYEVIALRASVESFSDETTPQIFFAVILKPDFFKRARECLVLGFGIEQSIMGLIYSRYFEVEFTESDLAGHLRFTRYGAHVDVKYILGGSWGNSKIQTQDYAPKIASHVKEQIKEKSLYRWNLPDSTGRTYDFHAPSEWEEIPAVVHGLNKPEWTAIKSVVLMNNFRCAPNENKLYKAIGISQEEADRGRHGSMIAQEMTRSAIRLNRDITVTVLDKMTADYLETLFKNTSITVSQMTPALTVKTPEKRGPKPKYATNEAKKEAERDQARERMRRQRERRRAA